MCSRAAAVGRFDEIVHVEYNNYYDLLVTELLKNICRTMPTSKVIFFSVLFFRSPLIGETRKCLRNGMKSCVRAHSMTGTEWLYNIKILFIYI